MTTEKSRSRFNGASGQVQQQLRHGHTTMDHMATSPINY